MNQYKLDLRSGAHYVGDGRCMFVAWAPFRSSMEVRLLMPGEQLLPMQRQAMGYWSVIAEGVRPGAHYFFRLDKTIERPDPASAFQPDGIHGPSAIVDHGQFQWNDDKWSGRQLEDYVIYELHVGTFSAAGTFEAVIPHLEYLAGLGITAIELMPVAQFPGDRNWGYDGVHPYAPQNSYGGPTGLKALVNACHRQGIAVILDVVYNHLGPEGNYLSDFGPYFTDRCKTPWGDAVNLDGPYSDEVRLYFIRNALQWISDYHIDALRLDAIHRFFDSGAVPFLSELTEDVHSLSDDLGRRIYIFAESDLNDTRVTDAVESGGFGFDSQWNDDYHHALHALLTSEQNGYYEDFGSVDHLAKGLKEGFIYSGQYSAFRQRRHGKSSAGKPKNTFIVFSQNHDQIGNRAAGDRLSATLPFEKLKLAACSVIFGPYIPLLFMGEEYGETAPFAYFVSHIDKALIDSVRRGRIEEFSSFSWKAKVPDPQDEKTFLKCKIDLSRRFQGPHSVLHDFHKAILKMRASVPALSCRASDDPVISSLKEHKVVMMKRRSTREEIVVLLHFGEKAKTAAVPLKPGCTWECIVDSSSVRWGGTSALSPDIVKPADALTELKLKPWSCLVYRRTMEA